jgi:ribA/ribD-fused uncharacterized protein
MENLSSIQQRHARGERMHFLFFWGHRPKIFGVACKACLSQWYDSPFLIDEILYPTAEHWMMASKARLFGDEAALAKILETPDPQKAKKWGREVRDFDTTRWQAACVPLVIQGNLAKFSQNESLKQFLLSTANSILVEASPVDHVWGIGLAADHPDAIVPRRWKGENLLGFALMAVRDRLCLTT